MPLYRLVYALIAGELYCVGFTYWYNNKVVLFGYDHKQKPEVWLLNRTD